MRLTVRERIVHIARMHNHLMVSSLAEAKQYAVQS